MSQLQQVNKIKKKHDMKGSTQELWADCEMSWKVARNTEKNKTCGIWPFMRTEQWVFLITHPFRLCLIWIIELSLFTRFVLLVLFWALNWWLASENIHFPSKCLLPGDQSLYLFDWGLAMLPSTAYPAFQLWSLVAPKFYFSLTLWWLHLQFYLIWILVTLSFSEGLNGKCTAV